MDPTMPRRRTHAVGYVFNVAPLLLLSGEQFLSAFTRPQLEALAYASLGVSGKLVELLTSIWGLWLFPFAVLTIKSNSLPKFLGVLLILSGVAYVLSFLVAVLFPDRLDTLNTFAFPLYFGELIVILWLAFVGAKPRGGGEHGRPVGSLA
jgi:hypothetical protein